MVDYVERCTVSRSVLEDIAREEGITVQNSENPTLGYCGLAARYFVDQKVFVSPRDGLMVTVIVSKDNLGLFTFPHDEAGNPLPGPHDARTFERGRFGPHEDYYTRQIHLPVSERDLQGLKPVPVCRPRGRNS